MRVNRIQVTTENIWIIGSKRYVVLALQLSISSWPMEELQKEKGVGVAVLLFVVRELIIQAGQFKFTSHCWYNRNISINR